MKTTVEILEQLIDALLDAEPVMHDLIREPLAQARRKLREIEALAGELQE
jgi:hypothetical protein